MNARRWFCVLVALVVTAAAAPAARAAEVFDLDPSHFSIVFSVSHLNRSYTYGIFRQAEARVVLDRENPAGCQFQMTINADSIDTNHAARDRHLKGPDFFNVTEFPTIAFESTACTLDNRNPQMIVYLVTGNLTMHGVTRQVTLPVQLLGEGPAGRNYTAGFVSRFELQRSEFGMTNLLEAAGDAIGIAVSFEAVRQDDAQPPQR